MASLFPFCCGDTQRWTETGRECLIRFSNGGETLNWVDFEGRGAYGQYFARIGRSDWIDKIMPRITVGRKGHRAAMIRRFFLRRPPAR